MADPGKRLSVDHTFWHRRVALQGRVDVEPPPWRRYMGVMNSAALTVPLADPDEAELLAILVAPHPVLRARCRPVTHADDDQVRDLVARMFGAMYRAPGIGLAAPQVGVTLRLAIVDLMPDEKKAPIVLINPEVVAESDELAGREEGCLSLPNQYAEVIRPARVKVRFTDIAGARRELEADGLLSACLQHEIEHLDGVLFIDHLSVLKRNILMRRLAKEQRQKDR
jgi:peptide deformylase